MRIERLSWPAIWAGAFVAMGSKLTLGMLGRWVSPDNVTLLSGEFPLASISMKMGLWYLVLSVLSMGLAGTVTSRFAANPRSSESFFHGLTAWALSSVINFYFLSVSAGGLEASLPGPVPSTALGIAASGQGIAALSSGWAFGSLILGAFAAGFCCMLSRPEDPE